VPPQTIVSDDRFTRTTALFGLRLQLCSFFQKVSILREPPGTPAPISAALPLPFTLNITSSSSSYSVNLTSFRVPPLTSCDYSSSFPGLHYQANLHTKSKKNTRQLRVEVCPATKDTIHLRPRKSWMQKMCLFLLSDRGESFHSIL
jgi:hypothetical protein